MRYHGGSTRNFVSRLLALGHFIKEKIDNNKNQIVTNKELQREILNKLLFEMRVYYEKIDSQGTLIFEDLFTKSGITYSGSEGQEYYFCKLLALNNVLQHNFPIIIDSFREGELSSKKEDLMIQEFLKLNKQIIFKKDLKDTKNN